MVSMPNYFTKALHKFQHLAPRRAQYAPHQWTGPHYDAPKKLLNPMDTLTPITKGKKRRIQKIVGTFLYYDWSVEWSMLTDLNTIAEQHTNPSQNTESAITQFLDYSATNSSAVFQYKSSDVILRIGSDASYLSEPWVCSRNGGHYYLSSLPSNPKKAPNLPSPASWPIHTEYIILKYVVASAAEAEVMLFFYNGQTAVPLRITLHKLGFPLPQTPIKTDVNSDLPWYWRLPEIPSRGFLFDFPSWYLLCFPFVGNYIFPRWGFTMLLISWVTTSITKITIFPKLPSTQSSTTYIHHT